LLSAKWARVADLLKNEKTCHLRQRILEKITEHYRTSQNITEHRGFNDLITDFEKSDFKSFSNDLI
jgi:hypothetical protein